MSLFTSVCRGMVARTAMVVLGGLGTGGAALATDPPTDLKARLTPSNGTNQSANDLHLELAGAHFTRLDPLTPNMNHGIHAADNHQATFANFTAAPGESVDLHIEATIDSNLSLDLTYFWTFDTVPIKYGPPGDPKQYFNYPKLMVNGSGGAFGGYDWQFVNGTDDDAFNLTRLTYGVVDGAFDVDDDTPGTFSTLPDASLTPSRTTGLVASHFGSAQDALFIAGTVVSRSGARVDFRYLLSQHVSEPSSLALVMLTCLLFAGRRPRQPASGPCCA